MGKNLGWILVNSLTRGFGIFLLFATFGLAGAIDFKAISEGSIYISAIVILATLLFFGLHFCFFDSYKAIKKAVASNE